jgi:hypothetical protein
VDGTYGNDNFVITGSESIILLEKFDGDSSTVINTSPDIGNIWQSTGGIPYSLNKNGDAIGNTNTKWDYTNITWSSGYWTMEVSYIRRSAGYFWPGHFGFGDNTGRVNRAVFDNNVMIGWRQATDGLYAKVVIDGENPDFQTLLLNNTIDQSYLLRIEVTYTGASATIQWYIDDVLTLSHTTNGSITAIGSFSNNWHTNTGGVNANFQNLQICYTPAEVELLTGLTNPYQSINFAILKATSGDHIILQHGSYGSFSFSGGFPITMECNQSTIRSIVLTGSGTELTIKGIPTITGSSNGITISNGAKLYGRFKDIDATTNAITMTDSGTYANIFARDIGDSATDGIEVFTSSILHLNARDIISTSEAIQVTSNAIFDGVFRDGFNNSSGSQFAIETSGTSPTFKAIFRDLYEPLNCCSGGSMNLDCSSGIGTVVVYGRNLPERGNRGQHQIFLRRMNAVMHLRDLQNQGNNQGTVRVNVDTDLTLICRRIYNDQEVNTRCIDSNGGGTQNINVIAHQILGRMGLLQFNSNTTGETHIDIDVADMYAFENDSRYIRIELDEGVTGRIRCHRLRWGEDSDPTFTLTSTNRHLDVEINHLLRIINSTAPTWQINGLAGMNANFTLHRIEDEANTISDSTLTTSDPNSGMISMQGSGQAHFAIDHFENDDTEESFCAYLYGENDAELHFHNTMMKSTSLCIGLEHGTGATGAAAFNDSAKLFFHGSNTLLGDTTVGSFTTDSTSIATINAATGKRTVVVNEGRINSNFDFESASAKGVPVLEPITGPFGNKVISDIYVDLAPV